MVTAVTFYDVVVFFHILAVVLAFGPTFAYPVFLAVAERTDPRALPAIGRGMLAWDRIAQAMLLVILIAGVYLAADRWEFSDFFIGWGFLAVIAIGALYGGFFTPKTKELIAIAERDINAAGTGPVTLSGEFAELNRKLGQVGTIAGLLIIVTIYFMTAKPFL